jgi:hypothetical protein
VLLAWSMRRHVRFEWLFTWSEIVIACTLLVLNLRVFPEPPADAGSVDLGPLIGLWYLIVTVRMAMSVAWVRERMGA